MPRKTQFYGWTLLVGVFSLDFVNLRLPRLRRYGPGAYIPALNGQRGFTPPRIIAALMPLVPGKILRPYYIISREVDGIGAVQNKVKAA
jgi:hypothetical protein